MLSSNGYAREGGVERHAEGSYSSVGFRVESPNVRYEPQSIVSDYEYSKVEVTKDSGGAYVARPQTVRFNFRTSTVVPRLGLMLVGWGGNNGATVTASIIANRKKLKWKTRTGEQEANYLGSVTQASTLKLGNVGNKEVYVPFSSVLPMVNPNDLVISGWDISSMNLADALDRAATLEPGLTAQLRDEMKSMVPLPSIYYPDFIAANQNDRADNLIRGTKKKQLDILIDNIKTFKRQNSLDKVVVLWTANTERYSDIIPGVNDTADNLLRSIERSESEVSASTIFAVASILAGAIFINGSPQNTFVPGVIELATRHNVFIGGDDFKSGQTKVKSVLVDFLVNAGIKPLSITSYNHLGNNDGMNLSSAKQFRSKEISKSSVVDDMVNANKILYRKGEHPDHTIVIKYVPSVGDSKRALDEYYSEIFMGGRSTISIYNVCEDSLLAAPIIIDLAIIAELLTRITYSSGDMTEHRNFHPVMSLLSYLLKAPLVTPGTPVINSLQRQRKALENVFRACVGLPPDNDMNLEYRCL